jgi:AbrB family transcriptional regulator (stage V sporulation protein T)
MKISGITRRVDDLGRIVIPKEIRNSLFITEGTPMEIIVTEDMDILLKKSKVIESISELSDKMCVVIYEMLDYPVMITDDEKIISCVGLSKKQYQNKPLSDQVKSIIHNSANYTASDEQRTTLVPIIQKDEMKFTSQIIIPIILDGKSIGLIVLLSNDGVPSNVDIKVMQTVSKLISIQLSN